MAVEQPFQVVFGRRAGKLAPHIKTSRPSTNDGHEDKLVDWSKSGIADDARPYPRHITLVAWNFHIPTGKVYLLPNHTLIATARYLAAHSPTVRAQGQTYEIASRLHRSERLFEG